MTSYQPRYTNQQTGLPTLDTSYPSMRAAHARAWDLVDKGLAKADSISFKSAHGEEYTIADLERILADNEVPFDPIA